MRSGRLLFVKQFVCYDVILRSILCYGFWIRIPIYIYIICYSIRGLIYYVLCNKP
jgi:hypothetical protein